jgi:parvulin-like peptidyl-prolyl isomerase
MTDDTIKNSVLEMIELISRTNEDRKKTAEIGKAILTRVTKYVDDHHKALAAIESGPLSDIISQHTVSLKSKILAEREFLIQSAAHSAGALEGTRLVHKKIIEIEEAAINSIKVAEENKKIEAEMERKVEDEGLEENKPREFGDRPESLKEIRNAKKRLKKKKEKDSESS